MYLNDSRSHCIITDFIAVHGTSDEQTTVCKIKEQRRPDVGPKVTILQAYWPMEAQLSNESCASTGSNTFNNIKSLFITMTS